MQSNGKITLGVFDSGFGGLTVLRALLPLIPNAHYIYLGDTARLPYGAKSQTTIARYAVESAVFLENHGADRLVIACNTATALALPDIRDAVGIPVTGVISPGAQAAYNAIHSIPSIEFSSRPKMEHSTAEMERPALPAPPQVLVLATTATVQSHAYSKTCEQLGLTTYEKACPLLVPMVEEGWTDHPVTRDVIRIYLREALTECNPSAVLLGCTHYPLIADEITKALREQGSNAIVVDSAQATASEVAEAMNLTAPGGSNATYECYATDSVEKFARLGSLFLHQPLNDVNLLDLGG